MTLDLVFFTGLLAGTLRLATPIMYAALGETLAQRSGVLNVGIEGAMLAGAFLAFYGSVTTGSPWFGLLFAMAGGAFFGLLHAVLCVSLRVDQIVAGIALVVLGLGFSGFAFRLTLGAANRPPDAPTFAKLDFGALSKVEFLGPVLFGHHALVYAGLAAALVLYWILHRSTWGLEIRAMGESPAAADAVGVRVVRTRYLCTTIGGVMAGMGGAYLSIAQVGGFVENMVSGRGFIAIACVVFGRWNPLGVMAAALFFGLADAAQIRLQVLNPDIPYQFFVMLPYVLAVVFLILFAGHGRMPAALGIPFFRGRGR